MTREEAIKVVRNIYQTDAEKEALETLIPELAESEDERIKKEIKQFIFDTIGEISLDDKENAWIAYLEKQKEPHIPWYDLQKSKEAGYTILKTEEYEELIKQKEQKPIQSAEEKEFVRTIKSIIADFIRDKKPEDVGFYQQIYDWLDGRHIEQKPVEWSEEDDIVSSPQNWDEFKEKHVRLSNTYMRGKADGIEFGRKLEKQMTNKWSEEDEKMLITISKALVCDTAEKILVKEGVTLMMAAGFLESLRPSWKPSEEQMEALAYAIQVLAPRATKASEELEHLREQLKKLI